MSDILKALKRLCDQLDGMKRTMFLRPGTGQHYSYLVHEDVYAYVEEARKVIAASTSQEPAVQAQDAARLDFLDTNAKFRMGWRVGAAPVGNLSVQSIIMGGKPIREAIDEAMQKGSSDVP